MSRYAAPSIPVNRRTPRRSSPLRIHSQPRRLRESAHAFYETLKDPARLEDALLRTTRAFGGEVAQLLVTGPGRTVSSSVIAGSLPSNIAEIDVEYRPFNPRIAAGHDLDAGGLTYDALHSTKEQIAADITYQEFFRRYGLDWYVGTKLVKDQRGAVLFGIFRNDRRGHFSKTEMAEFEWICSHAATAVDLMLLRNAERLRDAVSSVEGFAGSCAVMDKDGRIVEASARFLEVGRRSMLFRLEADGAFRCSDAKITARIGEVLCGVARSPADACSRPASHVLLARGPDGALWRVRALPLPERLPWIASCGRCLVTIDEVLQPPRQPLALLTEAFGMTPAEAAVAADLAEGAGLREVAKKRNVSYHTVRNQAKSIFDKTGSRTQADLARQLSRLLA